MSNRRGRLIPSVTAHLPQKGPLVLLCFSSSSPVQLQICDEQLYSMASTFTQRQIRGQTNPVHPNSLSSSPPSVSSRKYFDYYAEHGTSRQDNHSAGMRAAQRPRKIPRHSSVQLSPNGLPGAAPAAYGYANSPYRQVPRAPPVQASQSTSHKQRESVRTVPCESGQYKPEPFDYYKTPSSRSLTSVPLVSIFCLQHLHDSVNMLLLSGNRSAS